MKVVGPQIVPEADAVTDVETAGGDELVDGVKGGDAAVDDRGELFEVIVEGTQAKSGEQRHDVEHAGT